MAKSRKKPPTRMLYQHSPNVVEKFGDEDLFVSQYPLPGIDFHNNEQLARWVLEYGVAPDVLFRQGLAAPPLGPNTSGLRHYSAEFVGDPGKILNLDVPLGAQPRSVQDALDRIGIRRGVLPDSAIGITGEPMSTQELLWLDAMRMHGGFGKTKLSDLDSTVDPSLEGPDSMRNIAEWAASGDPAADALHNELGPIMVSRLVDDAGIQAASRMGPGWGAGTGYGPQSLGKSPMKTLLDEATQARAEGDILRAQEIENQLYEGDIPGNAVNVPAPTDGTREYKVFDPNAVNIKRVASILAAMGLGGSVASADDRYGDRTSRFSPAPQPESSPASYLDSALDSVNQGIAGAGNAIANYFGSDLDPQRMAAFQANPPPEYSQWLENATIAMNTPSVRVGPDETISPDEYFNRVAKENGFSVKSIENAKGSLFGYPHDANDKAAMAMRDDLLDALRNNLPGQNVEGTEKTAFDAGATPEEQADFANSPYGEQRYRLTNEGEKGFQSERVYNILSTFQNGSHRPAGADLTGKALATFGALPSAATSAFAGDYGGMKDTLDIAGYRDNTPDGRMREAMYWWNQGNPNGTAGDSLTGAKYPSLSKTTMPGLTTGFSNADQYYARYNQQGLERDVYNMGVDPKDHAMMNRMRDDLFRTTPRYPSGASPEEMRDLAGKIRDYDQGQRSLVSIEAPTFTKNYGISPSAWGGGHDFQGQAKLPDNYQPVKPEYLSAGAEMAANLPRDMMDWQTIATMGTGLIGKLASGAANFADAATAAGRVTKNVGRAAKAVGKQAAEFGTDAAGEIPSNYTLAEVNRPADTPGFLDAPEFHPMIKDEDGNPARADHPNYERYKAQAYVDQQNRLRQIVDRGTKLYGGSQ